jgi:anti-anti-sigma factor
MLYLTPLLAAHKLGVTTGSRKRGLDMSEAEQRDSADDDSATAQAPRLITHPYSGLAVRLSQRRGHAVARVSGEIDHTSADTFERTLVDHLLRDTDSLELELSHVGFFDCAGLNALLRARRVADHTGANLELSTVSPAVHRLLELTGTGRLFRRTKESSALPARSDRPPQGVRPVRDRRLRVRVG